MQDFTNNKLYEASGKAINENEMVRIKGDDAQCGIFEDATWEQWFDRTNKMLEVAANRSQELATHRNYRYDPKLGAVVDDYTKKVSPRHRIPLREGRRVVRPRMDKVHAAGLRPTLRSWASRRARSTRAPTRRSSTSETRCRRLWRSGRSTTRRSLHRCPRRADATPTTDAGYNYTPGPGGRGNKANWSKVP